MNTYIEINKKNLILNYLAFKKSLPKKTKIICVVKSNAYGYGLLQVVQILNDIADMYAVDNVEELGAVRKISSKRVIVFQQMNSVDIKKAIKLSCEFSVGGY